MNSVFTTLPKTFYFFLSHYNNTYHTKEFLEIDTFDKGYDSGDLFLSVVPDELIDWYTHCLYIQSMLKMKVGLSWQDKTFVNNNCINVCMQVNPIHKSLSLNKRETKQENSLKYEKQNWNIYCLPVCLSLFENHSSSISSNASNDNYW